MNRPLPLLLTLGLLCQGTLAEPKTIHVITNDKSINALNKKKIKQIYMAGDYSEIEPLTFAKGNQWRVVFNHAVIGLQESRINAYWAQMKFTGRAEPPLEFENEQAILGYLKNNPGCIAYVPAHINLPPEIRVLYTINY